MAERKAAPGRKKAPRERATTKPDKTTTAQDTNLPSRDLNPRQRAFVVEYLKDKNATQAYMRAYGVGAASAERAGPRLLGNVVVRSEIVRLETEALAKVQKETGITLERTLRLIAAGAFYDPRKFYNENGTLKPVRELDDDTAMALSGMEVSELTAGEVPIGLLKKIKMADRRGYADMLMKHLGGYKTDNEQRKEGLGEQLATFLSQIHESGAGRLPIAKRLDR